MKRRVLSCIVLSVLVFMGACCVTLVAARAQDGAYYEDEGYEHSYEATLDFLWSKNRPVYYVYLFLNPPFFDHAMVTFFTLICAVLSIVVLFMFSSTPEERFIRAIFLILGIYCWLRIISIALSIWLAGT